MSCDSCKNRYRIKCGKVTGKQFKDLIDTKITTRWTCTICQLSTLPFASLTDELFVNYLGNDTILDLTQQSDVSDPNLSELNWFNADINGYYKKNLKIGHLNVNSIYGKANEVIEVLNQWVKFPYWGVLLLSHTNKTLPRP